MSGAVAPEQEVLASPSPSVGSWTLPWSFSCFCAFSELSLHLNNGINMGGTCHIWARQEVQDKVLIIKSLSISSYIHIVIHKVVHESLSLESCAGEAFVSSQTNSEQSQGNTRIWPWGLCCSQLGTERSPYSSAVSRILQMTGDSTWNREIKPWTRLCRNLGNSHWEKRTIDLKTGCACTYPKDVLARMRLQHVNGHSVRGVRFFTSENRGEIGGLVGNKHKITHIPLLPAAFYWVNRYCLLSFVTTAAAFPDPGNRHKTPLCKSPLTSISQSPALACLSSHKHLHFHRNETPSCHKRSEWKSLEVSNNF